jgi:hypothetical protein
MYYLARLTAKDHTTLEIRTLTCLNCRQLIVAAKDLTDEEARQLTSQHYQRHDITHGVGPDISVAEVVFAPQDGALEQMFPDSLVLVLLGAT